MARSEEGRLTFDNALEPKMTKAMDARKSVQNLAETIRSLLGLKAHFTSSWVKSVCDIVRHLPSEGGACIDLKAENSKTSVSFGNKEDDLANAISKIKGKSFVFKYENASMRKGKFHPLNSLFTLMPKLYFSHEQMNLLP